MAMAFKLHNINKNVIGVLHLASGQVTDLKGVKSRLFNTHWRPGLFFFKIYYSSDLWTNLAIGKTLIPILVNLL